jgi:D-sedoheptulose 7-phosphate isomerase
MPHKSNYSDFLDEHKNLISKLYEIEEKVLNTGEMLVSTLKAGNKVIICGNGGSAADAQHFAAELVGRFEKERRGLQAIALTTDTSILTAIGNDYGYDSIFSRQIEALSRMGDTLIGISTSGNSSNVILAVEFAKNIGVQTIGLLGSDGGKMASLVDMAVIVSHSVTARIQEAHIFIIHFWCALIEKELFSSNSY